MNPSQTAAGLRVGPQVLASSFAQAQQQCLGCGRNDGSYNSLMPAALELALVLPPPTGRL